MNTFKSEIVIGKIHRKDIQMVYKRVVNHVDSRARWPGSKSCLLTCCMTLDMSLLNPCGSQSSHFSKLEMLLRLAS